MKISACLKKHGRVNIVLMTANVLFASQLVSKGMSRKRRRVRKRFYKKKITVSNGLYGSVYFSVEEPINENLKNEINKPNSPGASYSFGLVIFPKLIFIYMVVMTFSSRKRPSSAAVSRGTSSVGDVLNVGKR